VGDNHARAIGCISLIPADTYHSSYEKLRKRLGTEKLIVLVREIPARCQAVVDVHTK
jgi:hypothetical protein